MKYLVLIHVLSAVIGVGPTYFGHIFLRKGQTIGELKQSLKLSKKLEYFPKIGGSIAVLSGIALVLMSNLSFTELWIITSIILYVGIQVIVVGIVAPVLKELLLFLQENTAPDHERLPTKPSATLLKANRLYYLATGMGTMIFILMILKPML
ncbi:DUF2269 family protein [Ornithinibacillus scapharcae]|uniref:DUF2269 family protein n=1 Tax=Ornithinibacillus scapharcae TaxID=1147159 RepID=UPI000225BD15|nr:DUF2269 family protein [Ornithinibacillus scapharcae]